MSTIGARAPSNIAWAKYMGKKPGAANIPENTSLSMTLDGLCTVVEARTSDAGGDRWEPGRPERAADLAFVGDDLAPKGAERALAHVARVRERAPAILKRHGLAHLAPASLAFRSANTFPASSGIASSASAFAAITLATAAACARDFEAFARAFESAALKRELAALAREGSGSACRSFEGPFVQWSGTDAHAIPGALPDLAHFVVVFEAGAKEVGSSDAHARVKSSALWQGRVERVEFRARKIAEAIAAGDLKSCAQLAWSEAWDMHSLFHTAIPSFSYWTPATIVALRWLEPIVQGEAPPVVTLDAGPNLHITVEASQAQAWATRLAERFPGVTILRDRPGRGASFLSRA